MNIFNISINGTDIPIQKGTLRLVDFGNDTTIEVELNVHPTVVNFINTLGYIKERVTILSKHNAKINGSFDIHTGKSSILLVGNPKEIEGMEHLSSVPFDKRSFPLEQGEGITLDDELKLKQKSVLINILGSLLDNEIHDEGNRLFIHSLQEKLKKGEKLNIFDQYIKNEVSYLVEEALAKK